MSKIIKSCLVAILLGFTSAANASFLSGEALDSAANVLSWIVLIFVPVVFIYLFWIVHILPEKIAHKRHHPQKDAIQTLCMLSLFFGGLLWPIAWLWAYSKPVFYKMAYGTDQSSDAPDEIAALKAEISSLKATLLATETSKGV